MRVLRVDAFDRRWLLRLPARLVVGLPGIGRVGLPDFGAIGAVCQSTSLSLSLSRSVHTYACVYIHDNDNNCDMLVARIHQRTQLPCALEIRPGRQDTLHALIEVNVSAAVRGRRNSHDSRLPFARSPAIACSKKLPNRVHVQGTTAQYHTLPYASMQCYN